MFQERIDHLESRHRPRDIHLERAKSQLDSRSELVQVGSIESDLYR